ncbi:phage tail protein [Yersinia ruckeri]|uniref:phage tail protein n=1 Tax=Yersinia ruckeri TaxID=29486 RepID=UPI0020BFC24C|nr:phage tail protein [Yersinia ruckeri]EKN4689586.1 phage tail protein [Yersinia ruckeri]MCK8586392.1 phage tail protein [Yersinia ruckeri]MCW6615634.1 phage tail protein [Yersinia ruckeri]
MDEFPKAESGRYDTEGLMPKQFNRLFNQIYKDQRAKRRKANRLLTPSLLKNKNFDDVLALGKKRDGTFFTAEDLKGFENNRKQVRSSFDTKTAGITYAQLITNCVSIDVKRANNAVDDGSGIKMASFIGMEHSVAIISVTASDRSEDKHHRVKIRFEEWDTAMEDLSDKEKNTSRVVRQLCASRMSFDCDCGRHKYWYRYIATAGNFAISPPKEYVYPKIRNPNIKGVACKHVIHAMTRMQAGSWQMQVGRLLQKNARATSFGDDKKRTTDFFGDEQLKQVNRNRKSKTNHDAIKGEYQRYQKRMAALEQKLKKSPEKVEALRSQLKKSKRITDSQRLKLQEQRAQINQMKAQEKLLKQQLADSFILKKQTFMDALIMSGKDPKQAESAFNEYLKKQIKGSQ